MVSTAKIIVAQANQIPYSYSAWYDSVAALYRAKSFVPNGTDYSGPDAATAYNAALAALSPGGSFFLKGGTYPLSTSLLQPNNVNILGEGMYNTILQAPSAGVAIDKKSPDTAGSNVSGCRIADLTITGNNNGDVGIRGGIDFAQGSRYMDCDFSHLRILNCDTGILLSRGCYRNTLYRNVIEHSIRCVQFGVVGAADGANANFIFGGRYANTASGAVAAVNVQFADSICFFGGDYFNGPIGIRLDFASECFLSGVRGEGNTTADVLLTANATNNTVDPSNLVSSTSINNSGVNTVIRQVPIKGIANRMTGGIVYGFLESSPGLGASNPAYYFDDGAFVRKALLSYNLSSSRWEFTIPGSAVRVAIDGGTGKTTLINGISTTLGGGSITQILTKAGAPLDTDFTNPLDGLLVYDTTNHKLWSRDGGVWKGVVLT